MEDDKLITVTVYKTSVDTFVEKVKRPGEKTITVEDLDQIQTIYKAYVELFFDKTDKRIASGQAIKIR